ncbi:MAG: ATPase domain-containing protein [Candidatus Aenigmatarchaeota archaeon]
MISRKKKKPVSAEKARKAEPEKAKPVASDVASVKPAPAKKKESDDFIKTGIEGFDGLIEKGIPKGSAILIAGGAGSGKTIMCLQILAHAAKNGKKGLYMSFEESESRLRKHMEDFGWNAAEYEKKGNLMIKRMSSYEIARAVEGLLAKERGELLIDLDPLLLPDNYKPDIVVLDSLSAIASYFMGKTGQYRSYVEQLFRYFERMGTTSFMIAETKQIPEVFSPTGVEEFLADGVVVLYNIRKGDVRENAIEILKLRGTKHMKKIVAMQIVDNQGIAVYPDQEVFGGL